VIAQRYLQMEKAIAPRITLLLSALFIAAVPQDAAAHKHSSAGIALRLCSLVDEWGKAEKCSVSEWYRSVDIMLAGELSPSGARELCDSFVERAANLHLIFDVNWEIHIHSPSSGEHAIAVCELR
jgi:hypothetical protein